MSGRDCVHGRQFGKCDTCDLTEEQAENTELRAKLQAAEAENQRLREENMMLKGHINSLKVGFAQIALMRSPDQIEMATYIARAALEEV